MQVQMPHMSDCFYGICIAANHNETICIRRQNGTEFKINSKHCTRVEKKYPMTIVVNQGDLCQAFHEERGKFMSCTVGTQYSSSTYQVLCVDPLIKFLHPLSLEWLRPPTFVSGIARTTYDDLQLMFGPLPHDEGGIKDGDTDDGDDVSFNVKYLRVQSPTPKGLPKKCANKKTENMLKRFLDGKTSPYVGDRKIAYTGTEEMYKNKKVTFPTGIPVIIQVNGEESVACIIVQTSRRNDKEDEPVTEIRFVTFGVDNGNVHPWTVSFCVPDGVEVHVDPCENEEHVEYMKKISAIVIEENKTEIPVATVGSPPFNANICRFCNGTLSRELKESYRQQLAEETGELEEEATKKADQFEPLPEVEMVEKSESSAKTGKTKSILKPSVEFSIDRSLQHSKQARKVTWGVTGVAHVTGEDLQIVHELDPCLLFPLNVHIIATTVVSHQYFRRFYCIEDASATDCWKKLIDSDDSETLPCIKDFMLEPEPKNAAYLEGLALAYMQRDTSICFIPQIMVEEAMKRSDFDFNMRKRLYAITNKAQIVFFTFRNFSIYIIGFEIFIKSSCGNAFSKFDEDKLPVCLHWVLCRLFCNMSRSPYEAIVVSLGTEPCPVDENQVVYTHIRMLIDMNYFIKQGKQKKNIDVLQDHFSGTLYYREPIHSMSDNYISQNTLLFFGLEMLRFYTAIAEVEHYVNKCESKKERKKTLHKLKKMSEDELVSVLETFLRETTGASFLYDEDEVDSGVGNYIVQVSPDLTLENFKEKMPLHYLIIYAMETYRKEKGVERFENFKPATKQGFLHCKYPVCTFRLLPKDDPS